MAPIEVSAALSHVEGVSDSARARELYKYYQPNASMNTDLRIPTHPAHPAAILPAEHAPPAQDVHVKSAITSSKISSPDTALTAFCQLATWRTGAERAMISVVDCETQYFLAESTKTVDLWDNTKHAPGDEIWMGCGSVSKAGRLCERTITVAPTELDYPCFIVNDLSNDEQFNQLPFVTGPPFLKFYAGVPLITKRGIPIGSLFIVDSHVRPDLRKDEINFMGTLAGTIMKHMEMVREVEEHRRGMKMSRGLASFVEGRAELVEADIEAEDTEGTKVAGQFETDSRIDRTKSKSGSIHGSPVSTSGIERKEKEYSNALAKNEEAIFASQDQSDAHSNRPGPQTGSQPGSFGETSIAHSSPTHDLTGQNSPGEDLSEVSSMKVLFSRAANLIREAFEVDGGAVFYDTQRGFAESQSQQRPAPDSNTSHEESHTSGDDLQSPGEQYPDHGEEEDPQQTLPRTMHGSPGLGEGVWSRSSMESKRACEILGFSTADASSIHGDKYPHPQSFVPFDEKALHILLRRYPRGKLWTFDVDGAVSSSSEEEVTQPSHSDPTVHAKALHRRKMRSARAKSDARFLSRHFPGLRQLLFVPLWDAGRSRWLSGCCVWSTEPTRILSRQIELAFLTAFGNSVMAECSRIGTEIADQKKGDFIGSISHELRSPLHGILASAEFLGDEVTTGFEKGLVETIDSCGRTLLDTINHILDFSKINHFEKNWRKSRRGGSRPLPQSGASTLALRQSDLPMINLFADVDISVVCEEVVESVFAGHVFQNITAQSFDMVPDARGKMSDPKNLIAYNPTTGPEHLQVPEVAVILDVDVQNYHFTTQPGAFRRVIMNLLGNALKYTSHGYVKIILEASEMEDLHTPGSLETIPRSMVTVTVVDTGKGISSEFLRTKLFTPFAQENSLSSGTGLGLSIVRSIVALLEGEITFDSELGRGTQVRVTLPLLRELPKTADANSSNTPKSATSLTRDADESISLLRARVMGQKVSLHGFDLDTPDPIVSQTGKLLKASVTNFLTNWYGLQVVPFGQKASIIILNEASPTTISKIIRQSTINRKYPSILVLCSHSSRYERSYSQTGSSGTVGFVAKPVGPLKLARALLQCLEGAPSFATPSLLEPSSSGSNDLSSVFEELSLSPHGGEVLDNSRMAADSDNARKAIESPTPNAMTSKQEEFPFPVEDRPSIPESTGIPTDKDNLKLLGGDLTRASDFPSNMETTSPGSTSITQTASASTPSLSIKSSLPRLYSPRLLLVDDNKINLTLLRTYMRKRKYEIVDEAENGLDAVKKVEDRSEGYDIIFMDISMPVLDGFGATRQIRTIEELRRKRALALVEKQSAVDIGTEPAFKSPALVIALTGLASSRDQSEAFSSGIDLFLTKPVAFKEVGKMLDNWEANREKDARGSSGSTNSASPEGKHATSGS